MSSRVVYVSGGANGIGKAIVKSFLENGDTVIFSDIHVEKGKQLEELLKNAGYDVCFYHCDISKVADIQMLFQFIENHYGRLNIVVNNAGLSSFKSIWEVTEEDWNQIIATNLSSVFFTSREAAKLMKKDGGSIVNIASTRAFMSEENTEAYSASKGGIFSITHALAMTFSEHHITVNSISPGWIETENYESLRKEDHVQHPSKRVGLPEDIARACLFLTDSKNNFINGENIMIDGGMTKKMIYLS